MLNMLKYTIFMIVGALLPGVVIAERLDPGGGRNSWDYFVYGNGPAIVEILTSLKLLLAPDHGDPVFKYIMLFLAVIGFIVLAARAGFNPQQNFLKMFSFLLVVWFVNYSTTGLRVNINVIDRLNGYSHVVTGVPAIVGLPASVVSQTGEWLTRQLEQNFSIPGELSMTGGGAYDLVGRVMSDANKVMFTDDNLKKTVSGYVTNCMIPALAMGRVSVNDFTKSSNLLDTFAAASHNALTTIYYPPEGRADACIFMGADSGMGGADSCARVYACLREDLANHANALLDAGSEAWEKTGVFIPLETALSTALSLSGTEVAGYGRPQGYILQRAMISHMGGSFRHATTMTGNNELMMATSIAQAEQSQRTSWAVAAEIFNNMMGYVYLVLQAFILAIVPIVIISLMIPGLGSKVFVNYGQILIWLTLWSPMLAIINFLVALFWQQQMNSIGIANGLDMYNAGLMTAQTANLNIAAQFLGTMVPILTWGLVKGSMAFTEFISSGIGSSFATQAGAQAATGNVSMGNLSMDNVGMNKYNTAMSATVGFQDTNAFFNAATATASMQAGGSSASMNGGNVGPSSQSGSEFGSGFEKSLSFSAGQRLAESNKISAQNRAEIAENRKKLFEAAYGAKYSGSDATTADGTKDVKFVQGSDSQDALRQNAGEVRTGSVAVNAGASAGAQGELGGSVSSGEDAGRKVNYSATEGPGGSGGNGVNGGNAPGGEQRREDNYRGRNTAKKINASGKVHAGASAGAQATQTRQGSEGVDASETVSQRNAMEAGSNAQVRDTLTSTSSTDEAWKDALSKAKDFSAAELKSIADDLERSAHAAREEAQKWSEQERYFASQSWTRPGGVAGYSLEDITSPDRTSQANVPTSPAHTIDPQAQFESRDVAYDLEKAKTEAWIASTKAKAMEIPEKPEKVPEGRPSDIEDRIAAQELKLDRIREISGQLAELTNKFVALNKDNISNDAWGEVANLLNDGIGRRLGLPTGHEQGINGVIDTLERSKQGIGRFVDEDQSLSDEDFENIKGVLNSIENQVNQFKQDKKD